MHILREPPVLLYMIYEKKTFYKENIDLDTLGLWDRSKAATSSFIKRISAFNLSKTSL